MSQEHDVMAFRKRLKSAGYTDIHIYRDNSLANRGKNLYDVSAVEPLAGQTVRVSLSLAHMRHGFQRERGRLTSAYPKTGSGILTNAYSALQTGILTNA